MNLGWDELIRELRCVPPGRDLTLPGDIWQPSFWFVPVLRDRSADYVMPDTVWTGSISEIRKIASVAEAYYVPRSPYVVPAGPLELIAAAT